MFSRSIVTTPSNSWNVAESRAGVENGVLAQRPSDRVLDVLENEFQRAWLGEVERDRSWRACRTRRLSSSVVRSSSADPAAGVGPPGRKTALRKWSVGKFSGRPDRRPGPGSRRRRRRPRSTPPEPAPATGRAENGQAQQGPGQQEHRAGREVGIPPPTGQHRRRDQAEARRPSECRPSPPPAESADADIVSARRSRAVHAGRAGPPECCREQRTPGPRRRARSGRPAAGKEGRVDLTRAGQPATVGSGP